VHPPRVIWGRVQIWFTKCCVLFWKIDKGGSPVNLPLICRHPNWIILFVVLKIIYSSFFSRVFINKHSRWSCSSTLCRPDSCSWQGDTGTRDVNILLILCPLNKKNALQMTSIHGKIITYSICKKASWSKAWVGGRSLVGIADSNSAGSMYVCLLWVLCVVR
jgi:hypothetical protein